MGLLWSKSFTINTVVPGQGKEVYDTATKLKISQSDINALFRQFCNIDFDHSGIVDVSEFIVYHHITSEIIGELIFSLFDRDKSGKIDFQEYMVALWNYCTLNKDSLARFAFEIFDVDNSGVLTKEDIQEVIDIIWGYQKNERLNNVTKLFSDNKTGEIKADEFVEMSKHFPMLLLPIFEVQNKLQGSGLVRFMWSKLTKQRQNNFGNQTVFEILGIDKKLVDRSMDFLAE
jgi:Ca2+-binding EF-hand superfamily protein